MMSHYLNDPRYRPALLALAGVSAAYAIYLIQQRYVASKPTAEPSTQLRRRNAIRRHDAPRRRRARSSQGEANSLVMSERAISVLRWRDERGASYGFLDIHSVEQEAGQDTDRRRETQWPLLPSMLPTVEQFQSQEGGMSAEDARGLRENAELMFMDAFLVNQYPPTHTIGEAEETYLAEQLSTMGIAPSAIHMSIERFNTDPHFGVGMRPDTHDNQRPSASDAATEFQRMGDLMQALDGAETIADDHSNLDWWEGNGDGNADREGQNTLNLLYNIAADQARRDGYVHRGVECNGCGIMPIQGIRYRCANCLDFDLCESCESQELHTKTHVFYKIRVPAPSLGALGNSRQGLPVWYPGKPGAMPRNLPRELAGRLLQESGFDNSELDALWDQFRCLAGTEWNKDPNKLGMAIDRKTFDKCFVPPLSIRPPPPNLIYDRMFAFYDTNHDNLIGFEEFLKGLASLNDKSREGRLRRIFQGYDVDNDGYVERKDFLRMFRAFYTLSKELNREMVAGMEEDLIEGGARDIVHGSQPISSAFPGSIPVGQPSQSGAGKDVDANGDLAITDNRGVLNEESDDYLDRNQLIADTASRSHPPANDHTYIPLGVAIFQDHEDSAPLPPHFQEHGWPPPTEVRSEDIVNALGSHVPLQEVMDPVDRSRVLFAQSDRMNAETNAERERRRHSAVQERWRRRRFYTDVEEGCGAPPGFKEVDSSDDESETEGDALDSVTSASASRPLSPRSRSSSKVRFEDSVTDTDYETRSNTSSRSIPVGERWGGYDISEIEKDVGKEILYQAVQQGFNDLLDQLFKEKEDLAMEAHKTRKLRRLYAKEIQAYAESSEAKSKAAEEESLQKNDTTTTNGASLTLMTDTELDNVLYRAASPLAEPSSDDEADENAPARSRTTPPRPPPDHPIFSNSSYGFSMRDYLGPREPHIPPTQPPSPTLFHNNRVQDEHRDPTLPQFLPNEPGTTNIPPPLSAVTTITTTTTTTSSSPTSAPENTIKTPSSSTPSPINQTDPTNRPTSTSKSHLDPSTLHTYLIHNRTDAEAKSRNGFGKLDYEEFVRGMVGEEHLGERGGKGGGGGNVSASKQWGNGGGMGKLGFVGSWIEMASF